MILCSRRRPRISTAQVTRYTRDGTSYIALTPLDPRLQKTPQSEVAAENGESVTRPFVRGRLSPRALCRRFLRPVCSIRPGYMMTRLKFQTCGRWKANRTGKIYAHLGLALTIRGLPLCIPALDSTKTHYIASRQKGPLRPLRVAKELQSPF